MQNNGRKCIIVGKLNSVYEIETDAITLGGSWPIGCRWSCVSLLSSFSSSSIRLLCKPPEFASSAGLLLLSLFVVVTLFLDVVLLLDAPPPTQVLAVVPVVEVGTLVVDLIGVARLD